MLLKKVRIIICKYNIIKFKRKFCRLSCSKTCKYYNECISHLFRLKESPVTLHFVCIKINNQKYELYNTQYQYYYYPIEIKRKAD